MRREPVVRLRLTGVPFRAYWVGLRLPHRWGAGVVHRLRKPVPPVEHVFDNWGMELIDTNTELVARYATALAALDAVSIDVAQYRALPESALLSINSMTAASRRLNDSHAAVIAGEIAHRSAPELGSQGLAQRAGHRTAEQFVKISTGSTGRDAVTAVRVGVMVHEAATAGEVDQLTGVVAVPTQPWLAPVTQALADRRISVESADAIRAGLGGPNSAITAEKLLGAAKELCEAARTIDPDALRVAAAQFRDELDLDGVALREEERRAKRSLRLFVQADGTTKLVWIMDPETAAVVREIYDRATSPKRGGVRFVDPRQKTIAEQILTDDRTPDQLASDVFEQLLTLGTGTDPHFMLGSGAPVIRVTTTRRALQTGTGLVRIEGQAAPISMRALERLACTGILKPIVFDENLQPLDLKPLDLGREQRLFSPKQREALAVKWGGCAAPGCGRPPSWTETHHIVFWGRDKGRTNIADGIPLCKHHHLLFHNNGWEIERDNHGEYWLIPPKTHDPDQTPILLQPNGSNMRDLRNAEPHDDVASAATG
jgi:Domain of unknown function (DUF222)